MTDCLRRFLHNVLDYVFPRRCVVCRNSLADGEQYVCNACYVNLPFVPDMGKEGNPVEKLFWSYPVVRAGSLLIFQSGNATQRIVHSLKYGNKPEIGIHFGRIMAHSLEPSGFFKDIDAILPLPLSAKRQKHRGYNQSEMLARGISDVTSLPILGDAVVRVIDNPSQTQLSALQRLGNVRDIFQISQPGSLVGKHILVVDDVITTGATVRSLLETVSKQVNLQFSVLSLALAGHHFAIPTQET